MACITRWNLAGRSLMPKGAPKKTYWRPFQVKQVLWISSGCSWNWWNPCFKSIREKTTAPESFSKSCEIKGSGKLSDGITSLRSLGSRHTLQSLVLPARSRLGTASKGLLYSEPLFQSLAIPKASHLAICLSTIACRAWAIGYWRRKTGLDSPVSIRMTDKGCLQKPWRLSLTVSSSSRYWWRYCW